MIILTDKFNNVVISRHRTIKAAVKASHKHLRCVKKRNGFNSYIPTAITDSCGKDISEEVAEAEINFCYRG